MLTWLLIGCSLSCSQSGASLLVDTTLDNHYNSWISIPVGEVLLGVISLSLGSCGALFMSKAPSFSWLGSSPFWPSFSWLSTCSACLITCSGAPSSSSSWISSRSTCKREIWFRFRRLGSYHLWASDLDPATQKVLLTFLIVGIKRRILTEFFCITQLHIYFS